MLHNAGKLFLARKFRGVAPVMITRLEAQISKLENKPEITHSHSVIVQEHPEKLKSLE